MAVRGDSIDEVRVTTTEAASRCEERPPPASDDDEDHDDDDDDAGSGSRVCSLQDDFNAAVRSRFSNHRLFVSIPPWLDQLHEALFHKQYC